MMTKNIKHNNENEVLEISDEFIDSICCNSPSIYSDIEDETLTINTYGNISTQNITKDKRLACSTIIKPKHTTCSKVKGKLAFHFTVKTNSTRLM